MWERSQSHGWSYYGHSLWEIQLLIDFSGLVPTVYVTCSNMIIQTSRRKQSQQPTEWRIPHASFNRTPVYYMVTLQNNLPTAGHRCGRPCPNKIIDPKRNNKRNMGMLPLGRILMIAINSFTLTIRRCSAMILAWILVPF